MSRYLFAFTLLLLLMAVAFTQRTTASPQGGTANTYLPFVGRDPSPTPTLTPTATATPVAGTGVFKKSGSTIYHDDSQAYTGACGFILFANGQPAYGGPDGFRAEVCLNSQPGYCHVTAPVDATGYFEVSIADVKINDRGVFRVLQGRDLRPVSRDFSFNTLQDGVIKSLIRMDFKECQQNDTSDNCRLGMVATTDAPIAADVAAAEASLQFIPDRFCPTRP